jgi:hypothetical protein
MNVHILGFPAALDDKKIGLLYAIILDQVTSMEQNRMTLTALSAPCSSGSAIICTPKGVLVGYLSGGLVLIAVVITSSISPTVLLCRVFHNIYRHNYRANNMK